MSSKLLKFLVIEEIRGRSDEFMAFWASLNSQLTTLGYKEALYGDARDLFYFDNLPATQAVDQLFLLRGEK